MTNVAESRPEIAVARAATVAYAYPISITQFDAMDGHGLFAPDDKLELIHGLITRKAPIKPPHASATTKLMYLLLNRCPIGWLVRCQLPIAVSDDSMPQPDVGIVKGGLTDYDAAHPTAAQTALIIEVSEASLAFDLGVKLALYAAAKVPEYWVVDLVNGKLHVHTLPRGGKKPGYRSVAVLGSDETVPLTLRGEAFGAIRVGDFLPPLPSQGGSS